MVHMTEKQVRDVMPLMESLVLKGVTIGVICLVCSPVLRKWCRCHPGIRAMEMEVPLVLNEERVSVKWQLRSSDEVSPVKSGYDQEWGKGSLGPEVGQVEFALDCA